MTNRQEDIVLLKHILSCINAIHQHSGGILKNLHEYLTPWDATLRRLQIMSESATKLSDEMQEKMPAVQWHKIRGFRNILVHDYLGDIDPRIIRDVIKEHLPLLEQECTKMLKKLEEK